MSRVLTDFISERQWVAWRNEMRNGRPTKVPYVAQGRKAEADQPDTWLTHDRAVAVSEDIVEDAGGGIGIELGPCSDVWLVGIDLDTCRDPGVGEIEPWAQAILDRFNTYTEVSPSGTGVKVFLLIDRAAVAELRRIMGREHGRQFKRPNGTKHPPAIEIYISNRFFAVTWEMLDDFTNELRLVPIHDLRWLITEVGPAFKRNARSDRANGGKNGDTILARLAETAKSNKAVGTALRNAATMKGGSRSEGALGLGAALRRAGWTFEDMKAALLASPATRDWATEQLAEGDRQFERIWDKGGKEQPRPQQPGGGAELVPIPWVYRDPATIPPREWLVGTILIRGYATLLGSSGGVGKTALAIALALSFVTGRKDILGQHVFQTGKAWLITLEDDRQELERRIAAAMIAHGILPGEVAGRLFVNGDCPLLLARADKDGAFVVCTDADALAEGIVADDIGLTVIDPLVKSHRLIENSNEHMDQLQALANGNASRTRSSILLAVHFRKGGGEDAMRDAIRGGSALVDGARIARTLMTMTRKETDAFKIPANEAIRYVRMNDAKANLAPKDKVQWFELTPIPLGNRAINPAYPNGDNMQAAKAWEPPTPFKGLDAEVLERIFARIRTGPEPGWFYSSKRQAKFWAGAVIIEESGKSIDQAIRILATWIENEVLTEADYRTPSHTAGTKLIPNEGKIAEILSARAFRDVDE